MLPRIIRGYSVLSAGECSGWILILLGGPCLKPEATSQVLQSCAFQPTPNSRAVSLRKGSMRFRDLGPAAASLHRTVVRAPCAPIAAFSYLERGSKSSWAAVLPCNCASGFMSCGKLHLCATRRVVMRPEHAGRSGQLKVVPIEVQSAFQVSAGLWTCVL